MYVRLVSPYKMEHPVHIYDAKFDYTNTRCALLAITISLYPFFHILISFLSYPLLSFLPYLYNPSFHILLSFLHVCTSSLVGPYKMERPVHIYNAEFYSSNMRCALLAITISLYPSFRILISFLSYPSILPSISFYPSLSF